jgi:hypothetical protein
MNSFNRYMIYEYDTNISIEELFKTARNQNASERGH